MKDETTTYLFDDGTEPTILPHYGRCNGPCDQGRKNCPTPEACELAADIDSKSDGLEAAGLLALAIAVVAAISLVVASVWRFA